MNLIGIEEISATAYKKARAIMFDNSGELPIVRIYENTVIPGFVDTPSGEYAVNYSPEIIIPLLNPLAGGTTLSIDDLMMVLLSVYKFGREYKPVIADALPE